MNNKRSLFQTFVTPFGDIPASAAMIAGAILWIAVLGAWAVATYGGYVRDMFLPVPDAVVRRAITLAADGSLFVHMWSSIKVVLLGFLVSAAISVPLGLYMGTYRIVQAALEPMVNFIRYLPVTSLVPLFILWIGIGIEQRITVIFFGTFFSQLVMIADEARAVSRDLVNASYTLGTKRSEAVWHVIFPAALPGIINTLRVTMGWAWTYLVVAELVAANSGLGFISLKAMRGFQVDTIFLAIVLIGLLGLISDLFFRYLRRRLAPWAV
ncbi:ABC transporter permease [Taklimakanibacter lacteus]|uniref:ABC transporter permease n=1 Tax=Taklimakanibacter lacteus TaxID=2268456 RepID=UPI000E671EFA